LKIDTDMSAIDLAIQDAFVCGTGIVKVELVNGKLSCDNVPIKNFYEFGEQLQWLASQNIQEPKQ
jgi:hypothetical protein